MNEKIKRKALLYVSFSLDFLERGTFTEYPYNKRKGFTFPLYPDPKREVTGKFASQYIPRSYLIDKEGKVISATVGYKKEEMDKLMKEIDKALK